MDSKKAKQKLIKFAILIFSIYSIFVFPLYLSVNKMVEVKAVNAATLEELQQQRADIQKKLDAIAKNKADTNKKIADAKAQKSSTESQIRLLSLEIDQQQLIINEKETVIEQKQNEIAILEDQIVVLKKTLDNLDVAINQKKQIADKRLQNIYKVSISQSTLDIILNATSAQDFLAKLKYQRLLRGKDEEVLVSLKGDRDTYDKQKNDFVSKKTEVQTLTDSIVAEKAELEKDKNALAIQRSDQQTKLASLSSTVGFQQKLYDSLSTEQQQLENQANVIQSELFSKYKQLLTGTKIKKDTDIGIMGSTGYSTGPHLHFFVTYNSTNVNTNPCSLLPTGVVSGCGVASPKMVWPMSTPLVFSRGFTSAHQAVDIVGLGNITVKAAHDGWVTFGNEPSCDIWKFNPTAYYYCKKNGPAHYAIICENKDDCSKGLKTGYWHLKN
ncbi:MAG: peptidoglycan DD-metalloendopeptidase family protein [bacterium]